MSNKKTNEVEVEEEITEHTEFKFLIEVSKNGSVIKYTNMSISRMKDRHSKEFHTVIDGELVKIWERE